MTHEPPPNIHPTALIAPSVVLGPGCQVDAYAVIGSGVQLGARCHIGAHVVLEGPTCLGDDNRVYPFSCVGVAPQDKKYHAESSRLIIGNRNTLREHCSIHRGTANGGMETRIGDDNWIMAFVHIAHDCVIGNANIMANNASLAGHVTLEDRTVLGGFTLISQFCRVGQYAFTGMGTQLNKDLPPYMKATGVEAEVRTLNTEGMRRGGMSKDDIHSIKQAFRLLYRQELPMQEAIQLLEEQTDPTPALTSLLNFISHSERGILRGRRR